jgi:hypothetical protein
MKDQRIEKLREILENQIEWYLVNKEDDMLVYDEMVAQFITLRRGDFVEIIKILVHGD